MKASKVARYGLLVALALVLSYAESLIPPVGVPGVKLGLPNLAVVFALYRLGAVDAWVISLIRVGLAALLFGNGVSLAYSITGAALSLLVMCLLKRTGKFSETGVSVAGGVSHNIGQILVAVILLGTTRLAWYLPVLCVSGTVAGILIGVVSALLVKRVPELKSK